MSNRSETEQDKSTKTISSTLSPTRPVIPVLNVARINAAAVILYPNSSNNPAELRSLTDRPLLRGLNENLAVVTERINRQYEPSRPLLIEPMGITENEGQRHTGMKQWLSSIKADTQNVRKLPEFDKVSALASPSQGSVLDVSHKKFGDQRMYVLATALKSNERVRILNISDNRLSDQGFALVFSELSASSISSLECVDISDNSIKRYGCDGLAKYLASSQAIRRLYMRNMGIENSTARRLANVLRGSSIVTLQLSKNNIEDSGAVAIANYLSGVGTCSLVELDLSWNQIKSSGGCALVSSVRDNKTLESLDLSWNALASTGLRTVDRSFSKALSAMLANNSTLVHLNISNNHLLAADCVLIGEGLKTNHSLLGLHMVGNEARVDPYGELIADATPWPLESAHTATRIIGGQVTGREGWSLRSNCWICGRWREHRFVYSLTEEDLCRILKCSSSHLGRSTSAASTSLDIYSQFSSNGEAGDSSVSFTAWELKALPILRTTSVLLLTSFDNWVPENMAFVVPQAIGGEDISLAGPDRTKGRYEFELFRMVPPGQHSYLFSVGGAALAVNAQCSTRSLSEFIKSPESLNAPAEAMLPQLINTITIDRIPDEQFVPGISSLFIQHAKPRTHRQQMAKLWTPQNSIFAKEIHVMNHKTIAAKCFSSDWTIAKVASMKDSGQSNRLYSVISANYSLLMGIFVHYSCLYSSEVFYMGIGAFSEFIQRCRLIDQTSLAQTSIGDKESAKSTYSTVITMSITTEPVETVGVAGSGKLAKSTIRIDIPVRPSEKRSTVMKSPRLSTRQNGSDVIGVKSVDGLPPTSRKTVSNKAGTFVQDQFNRTDIDMIFISNCITGPKHECNGKRYLNRFQFIDAIIALAQAKFSRPSLPAPITDLAAAVEKLIAENIEPYAERDDALEFRRNYLLTQVVDEFLRNNLSLLEKVYRSNSGSESDPLEEELMCIKEWMTLCGLCGLIDDRLGERTFKLSFCRSLAYNIQSLDYANSSRQLGFFEFLEAVVRVAHAIAAADKLASASSTLGTDSVIAEGTRRRRRSVDLPATTNGATGGISGAIESSMLQQGTGRVGSSEPATVRSAEGSRVGSAQAAVPVDPVTVEELIDSLSRLMTNFSGYFAVKKKAP